MCDIEAPTSRCKLKWKANIVGKLPRKSFDITKAAGGVAKAHGKTFNVTVTENYLELHLFWAGKVTCCVPKQGYCGPLIAAVHVVAELLGIGPQPNSFSYAELKAAAEDFNPSNNLGKGGFGMVYKGTLSDGREIAIEQLSVVSNHWKTQFITEIATECVVQHCNLVKLLGCCIEGKRRMLVYEYHENESLDQLLFARGLAYLHEEPMEKIVHRDVKASNILLDATLCPKISDFGLAKLYDDNKTHFSTHNITGTIEYLAPEYALWEQLREKADLFGFGIVALEIVSGKPNFFNNGNNEETYLLDWVMKNNQILELLDPSLAEFDETEVEF